VKKVNILMSMESLPQYNKVNHLNLKLANRLRRRK